MDVIKLNGRDADEIKQIIDAGDMVYIGDNMSWVKKWYFLKASKWRNPHHKLLKKGYTREQVLSMYKEDLLKNEQLLKDLHELEGKTLACWCSPELCHGDVLVELIEGKNKYSV